MAALHLALEVDGDVYPELHAALSAIGSEASRAERLRQLAAAGLVWEKIRTRADTLPAGPAAPEAPATPQGPPPVLARRPASVPVPAPVRVPMQAPGPAPVAVPAGFVDLALDAVAPPAQAPWPPVLVDVVDPEELPHAVPARRARMPPPAAYDPPEPEDPIEPLPIPAAPEAPLEHHASTRSRLQRMKEKGLFKNG